MLKREGRDGPYNMLASAVPQRLFSSSPKSAEAIAEYRRAVGDDEALATLRDYAASQLRRAAERPDGTLDPAKVETWRRRHQDALRSFPDLDRRFADAGRASETMAETARARNAALDEAQRGKLGALLKVEDPDDVTRTIGGIFSAQDSVRRMMDLRRAIGKDTAAQQGLRKTVVDHITKRFVGNTEAGTSGLGTVKSDAFQSFVKQNGSALRAAGFTADELKLTTAAIFWLKNRRLDLWRDKSETHNTHVADDTIAGLMSRIAERGKKLHDPS